MGQFGSLSDMMSYSVRNHTATVAANLRITDKLSLFASIVHNDGRGSLGSVDLDASQVPAIPPGFDYAKISEIGRFSALSIGRTQQVYGLNYNFTPNWVLSASAYYSDYDDRSPYLFDTNGRSAGAEAGISYVF